MDFINIHQRDHGVNLIETCVSIHSCMSSSGRKLSFWVTEIHHHLNYILIKSIYLSLSYFVSFLQVTTHPYRCLPLIKKHRKKKTYFTIIDQ